MTRTERDAAWQTAADARAHADRLYLAANRWVLRSTASGFLLIAAAGLNTGWPGYTAAGTIMAATAVYAAAAVYRWHTAAEAAVQAAEAAATLARTAQRKHP